MGSVLTPVGMICMQNKSVGEFLSEGRNARIRTTYGSIDVIYVLRSFCREKHLFIS